MRSATSSSYYAKRSSSSMYLPTKSLPRSSLCSTLMPRMSSRSLGDAEGELDQQHADNEAGFGKDLDVGDVAFNPMATGVPGMDRPADAFGNEIQQRQMHAQNDMVDVQAEVFQVRQDYGQVQTGMPRGGM